MKKVKIIISLIVLSTLCSAISYNRCAKTNIMTIDGIYDLQGDSLVIPYGTIIQFEGGVIKSGKIIGNNTTIKGSPKFENVKISGEWHIQDISSDFIRCSDDTQKLQNLFALTSNSVYNKVTIEEEVYDVNIEDLYLVKIKDSTDVILNGQIYLRPNKLQRYYMFLVDCCTNVNISGKGAIVGDYEHHIGNDGEWGMGICIKNSQQITIQDMNISGCWGDCITISGASNNIDIVNCTLHGSRRQGISICDGSHILVDGCNIYQIGGTDPGHGIDIEPDPNNHVSSVIIMSTKIADCWGGILSHGGAMGASVGNIILLDNEISGMMKYQPINIYKTSKAQVLHNTIRCDNVACIYVRESSDCVVRDNELFKSFFNSDVKIDSKSQRITVNNNQNRK